MGIRELRVIEYVETFAQINTHRLFRERPLRKAEISIVEPGIMEEPPISQHSLGVNHVAQLRVLCLHLHCVGGYLHPFRQITNIAQVKPQLIVYLDFNSGFFEDSKTGCSHGQFLYADRKRQENEPSDPESDCSVRLVCTFAATTFASAITAPEQSFTTP